MKKKYNAKIIYMIHCVTLNKASSKRLQVTVFGSEETIPTLPVKIHFALTSKMTLSVLYD